MIAEITSLAFALGPIIWIALTVWIVARHVKKSRLRSRFFVAAILTEIVLFTLPFLHYNRSVSAAGLSEFTSCPYHQEYCEEIWELEALDAQLFFFLGFTFWVGIVLRLLTLLLIPRKAGVGP